ncbi:MAG: DUF3035 domain-containing protein [Alphaproteobacteria bacterium]|nr:DUF3035 domain-containing protein [Alphaproteobacteria bacterium]
MNGPLKMKHMRFFLCALALLALPACSGLKQELGVGRHSPDEFTVVKRAPLTLPPSYELRPPSENAAPAASASASRARTVLMGAEQEQAVKGDADAAFLQKAGALGADPAVRNKIAQENGRIALENKSVADKLIFWKDEEGVNTTKNPSNVVDPKAEKERLQKNAEEGKPLNEGEVPTIEKRQGTLDKLLGG